jgi:hypothetical protein
VRRSIVERYRARTASLAQELAPHPVSVTGPWPAFAFVPEVL